MPIAEITLIEDATMRIVQHRSNVRNRLTIYKATLENSDSTVCTAELLTPCDLEIKYVFKTIVDDLARYQSLNTEFNALHAGYDGSEWKADVDAAIAALSSLRSAILNALNNNFQTVEPPGEFYFGTLDNTQKNSVCRFDRNGSGLING